MPRFCVSVCARVHVSLFDQDENEKKKMSGLEILQRFSRKSKSTLSILNKGRFIQETV